MTISLFPGTEGGVNNKKNKINNNKTAGLVLSQSFIGASLKFTMKRISTSFSPVSTTIRNFKFILGLYFLTCLYCTFRGENICHVLLAVCFFLSVAFICKTQMPSFIICDVKTSCFHTEQKRVTALCHSPPCFHHSSLFPSQLCSFESY